MIWAASIGYSYYSLLVAVKGASFSLVPRVIWALLFNTGANEIGGQVRLSVLVPSVPPKNKAF